MVRCPNCGYKASGDYCQCCKYPILSSSSARLREADKRAKKEAEEAEKRAKKEAKDTQKVAQDIASEIYEENVELVVPSPVGFKQVRQFKECLEQVENLRIVWDGWSVNQGVIIAVSVEKPMTVIPILNEMPTVEKVDRKGKKIVVMLKPPTATGQPIWLTASQVA